MRAIMATVSRGYRPLAVSPDSITTCDLVTLPYPTRFGLFRASTAIAPFLSITNRMLVIRWRESDGRPRTLLFEPSDVERGQNTPYFLALAQRTPNFVRRRVVVEHGTVLGHLARLGIAAGAELALPRAPFTIGLRVEQGLTELAAGARDRAVLAEVGVDLR